MNFLNDVNNKLEDPHNLINGEFLYKFFERMWREQWCQYISDNLHKNWDYDDLSYNPNLTWEFVQANPTKPWYYSALSYNPNITWEIVQANQNKPWDYQALSRNPMKKAKNDFIRNKFRKHFKKSAVEEEMVNLLLHPDNLEFSRKLGVDVPNFVR